MRLTARRIILFSILAVIGLFLGVVAVSLFGPSAPIAVSRQTTYLTDPIDEWGNVDYVEALRRQWSDGVTPEENAAALIWQATGPAEIPPESRPSFYTELGIAPLPLDGDYWSDLRSESMQQQVAEWMRTRRDLAAAGVTDEGLPPDPDVDSAELVRAQQMQDADAWAEFLELVERTQHGPWRADDFPPLADWLAANDRPLALVVEASTRPTYYSPLIVGGTGSNDAPLISALLPDVQSMRGLARALGRRAMLRLGEGNHRQAWQDLQAMHRLARLVGQRGPLVSQLVAIAIDNLALRADAALLHEADLSVEEAHEIHAYLMQLGPGWDLVRSVDHFERLMILDLILHIARERISGEELGIDNGMLDVLRTGIDWNIPLQMANRWYDRIVAAMERPSRPERKAAMAAIENDLAALQRELTAPATLFRSAVSQGQRSEVVGGLMLASFLPAINAVQEAEERSLTTLRLVQTAAALAVHRAESGAYPDSLEDLAADLREEMPVDPFSEKPFLYEKRGDGYVLWSVGRNLQDDAASGRDFCVTVEGDYANDWALDPNHDDIVLRIPWSAADRSDSHAP